MDISDGLVDDLGKLCRASGIGARIHALQVPVDDRLKATFPASWLSLALGGGEDYELLFTAPGRCDASRGELLLPRPSRPSAKIVPAGEGVAVLDADGNALDIGSGGWDHFRGD